MLSVHLLFPLIDQRARHTPSFGASHWMRIVGSEKVK
jgi:hypothetical protein